MNQYLEEFPLFFRTGIPSYVLYPSLLFSLFIIVLIKVKEIDKQRGNRLICWVLLFEYLFIVVCSTIVFRGQLTRPEIEIAPFWTYHAVFNHLFGVSIWDIILNTLLFVPLGFLVNLLYPTMSVWKIAIVGLFLSIVIESSQYIWMKGICQFDDLMHNTIGCLMGVWLSKAVVKLYGGRKK